MVRARPQGRSGEALQRGARCAALVELVARGPRPDRPCRPRGLAHLRLNAEMAFILPRTSLPLWRAACTTRPRNRRCMTDGGPAGEIAAETAAAARARVPV